jgi:hypothetical protein
MKEKNEFQVTLHGDAGENNHFNVALGISDERTQELMKNVAEKFAENFICGTPLSESMEEYTEHCRSVNEVALVAYTVGKNTERIRRLANSPEEMLSELLKMKRP